MTIDEDTLKRLLRINDGLFQLCKSLTEKRDIETSSRLIPLVDELTHILLEAGKEKTALMQSHGDTSSTVQAINGRCLKCGYRFAWVVLRGKRLSRQCA